MIYASGGDVLPRVNLPCLPRSSHHLTPRRNEKCTMTSNGKRQDSVVSIGGSEPSTSLATKTFADRWESLPDELKLEILSYILAKDIVYVDSFCWRHIQRGSPLRSWIFLPHQLSQLATEVFYRYSRFDLERDVASKQFWYPKPCVNSFIRYLRVRLDLKWQDWMFLSRLASGELGFDNLQEVGIYIHGDSIYVRPAAEVSEAVKFGLQRMIEVIKSNQICFRVRKLEVNYLQNLAQEYYPHPLSQVFDELEEQIFQQLFLQPRNDTMDVDEMWERRKRMMIRKQWY